jgi:hypothetical protein
MVAVLRWFSRALHLCRSLFILRVHQDLNFSSRLTPPWSAHIIQVRFGFLEETMNFDELVQLQALKLEGPERPFLPGRSPDRAERKLPELRQMCAKVHPLIDRLDQVTNLLDMSKREFIEAAVSDAIRKAQIQIGNALDQDEVK